MNMKKRGAVNTKNLLMILIVVLVICIILLVLNLLRTNCVSLADLVPPEGELATLSGASSPAQRIPGDKCDGADMTSIRFGPPDGKVDSWDYNLLSRYWMRKDCSANNSWCKGADFTGLRYGPRDGKVDSWDYNLLSANWLRTDCLVNATTCTAESNATFCSRLGKECDFVTANDNCGTLRTEYCGTCSAGYYCNSTSGRCVASCTNDCTPTGSKRCLGSYAQTCGNYDADSCLEWNTGTYCSAGCSVGNCNVQNNSCTDSDGGLVYNIKGNATGYYSGSGYIYIDSCISNLTLNEQYCSGNYRTSANISCVAVNYTYCSSGKCI